MTHRVVRLTPQRGTISTHFIAQSAFDSPFKFLNTPLYPATIEGWYHGTSVLNSVMIGYW